jgi:hypothetical protein
MTTQSTFSQLFTSSLQANALQILDKSNSLTHILNVVDNILYLDGQVIQGGGGGPGQVTSTNLTSTTLGLGTLGYISSTQLASTIAGLGSLGYVSSVTGVNLNNLVSIALLDSTLRSTTAGLGSLGYISAAQLISTAQGLIDTLEVTSTIQGLGTLGYVSTYRSTTQQLFTSSLQVSSIQFRDIAASNFGSLSLSNGTLYINGIAVGTGSGSGDVTSTNLVSTVVGLGTFGYISAAQLISTTQGLIDTLEVTSTTIGLGTLGYISSNSAKHNCWTWIRGLYFVYVRGKSE